MTLATVSIVQNAVVSVTSATFTAGNA
jgi:hypothetical protein